MKVLSICMWDVFLLSTLYNSWLCTKKGYVLTTASLSELLAWKTGKETGERLKPGDSLGLGRSGEHPDLEGPGMKGWTSLSSPPLQLHPRGTAMGGSFIHYSCIHLSDISWATSPPTMYWKYIMVSSTLYLLNKCVLNEWNLEKQLFMS